MEKPAHLPDGIARDAAGSLRYGLLQGNTTTGQGLRYGWHFRLGRHTSDVERDWLKSHGWAFGGGQWVRFDADSEAGPCDLAEAIDETTALGYALDGVDHAPT